MLCSPIACGCAISTDTLEISGSGTPADPWTIDDTGATAAAIAALQASLATAEGDIDDLEAAVPVVGGYSTWTPTYSNLTIGTSTVTARYARIGPIGVITVSITFASGFSITGAPSITNCPLSFVVQSQALIRVFDASAAGNRIAGAARLTGNTIDSWCAGGEISATVPITWVVTDAIHFTGVGFVQ